MIAGFGRRLAVLAVALTAVLAAGVLASDASPPAMLLVARPQIDDPRFRESVVLVIRHGRGGPLGIIVNKPSPVALGEVFGADRSGALADERLFFGGPVEPQRLIALYRHAETQPRESLEIADRLWMTQSPAMLERLLAKPPSELRILSGFSGWAPGQLEHEIARGDWFLQPLDQGILFTDDPAKLWQHLLKRASERKA